MPRLLDTAAVSLSGLCMAHCLLLPIAAASLPFLGLVAEADWVHWLFFGLAAPVTVLAIGPRLLEHPAAWRLPALAALGLGLLLGGALDYPSDAWGEGLTIAGGALLAAAHLINQRRGHHGHKHA